MKAGQGAPGLTILFDADCALCRQSKAWLEQRDAAHRLTFVPINDPQVAVRYPALNPVDLQAKMHVVTPTGQVYAGSRAFWEILRVLPHWCKLVWLYHLPGMPTLSEKIYTWIANHRQHMTVCRGNTCTSPKGKD